MKKTFSLVAILALLVFTLGCTQHHARGSGMGAAIGGVTGAMLDRNNAWRGGVIGAVLGAIAGASVAEISTQASQDAVRENRPVEYRTTDGRGVYRADPLDYNAQTKCHKVQERVWEDDQIVKNQIKEICEGDRTEQKY